MLSILIPVFNYRMEALVSEISMQCERLNIPHEIILLDDGSEAKFKMENSRLVEQFEALRYCENEKNLGRSASRNRLMQESRGEWLWFLDCDGRAFINEKLVENFWHQKDEHTLLSGGRVYMPQAPVDKSKQLHWIWGAKRELIDAAKRMADPVNNFLSNNFFVSRLLIKSVQFDTRLSGYGYEDTVFAASCVEQGFRIKHIENPVLHEGLDSTEDFISKIEESLQNLLRLDSVCHAEGINNPLNSKLYRTYKQMSYIPIVLINPFAQIIVKIVKEKLIKGLHSLFWFDVYRLFYLMQQSAKARRTNL